MTKTSGNLGNGSVIIGETTPIRIGLVLTFLLSFGSAIWWASNINSKLDSLLANQATMPPIIERLQDSDRELHLETESNKQRLFMIERDIDVLKEKRVTPKVSNSK